MWGTKRCQVRTVCGMLQHHPPTSWVCQAVLCSTVMECHHTNQQLLMNLHWCIAPCTQKTNHISNIYIGPTVLPHCFFFHFDVTCTCALQHTLLTVQTSIHTSSLTASKTLPLVTFTAFCACLYLTFETTHPFVGIINN